MSQLDPEGYTAAVRMLCGDDIGNYLPSRVPAAVYCGSLDAVTTPADCQALATHYRFPFERIDGAGHACYVEQPDAVAACIRTAVGSI